MGYLMCISFPPYFDHDAFMHHSMHVLEAPVMLTKILEEIFLHFHKNTFLLSAKISDDFFSHRPLISDSSPTVNFAFYPLFRKQFFVFPCHSNLLIAL